MYASNLDDLTIIYNINESISVGNLGKEKTYVSFNIKKSGGALKRVKIATKKHTYNGKSYTVNIGSRGGLYIVVSGEKKYIKAAVPQQVVRSRK